MSVKPKRLDTSDDLHLYRFGNGIKLVRPDQTVMNNACQFARDTGHTVGSILQLPISFYFLNAESVTEKINDEGVSVCGFESSKKSIGKSLFDVSKVESAGSLIDNCRQVIKTKETKIFEELNLRNDGLAQQFLSIKSPWYDQHDNIVGVCGFSIVLGKHPLADSLSTIARLGLLNSLNSLNSDTPPVSQNNARMHDLRLSKREAECLRLTIKGCTAKKIARMLDLSHRTIEEYLTNIKIKMGVKSKSELIEMAVSFYSQAQDA